MKIGVFGAGAIGGAAGAFLARAGHDVSLIGRGAHFAAMRDNGVRIVRPDGEFVARPACPASPAEAGPQEAVIVATKAQAIGEVAELIQPMLRDDTIVVVAQNGVPFWFFHRLGGSLGGNAARLGRSRRKRFGADRHRTDRRLRGPRRLRRRRARHHPRQPARALRARRAPRRHLAAPRRA